MFTNDLASTVVAAGYVLDRSVFIGALAKLPATEGPIITLVDTGGTGPVRVQESRRNTRRPTAQVAVRAASASTARTVAEAMFVLLDGIYNTTVNGTFYLSITARQDVTEFGQDANGRAVYGFNLDAEHR